MPNSLPSYDELLLAHLEKLQEIDRRLDDLERQITSAPDRRLLGQLRCDLAIWIKAAAEDYEAF